MKHIYRLMFFLFSTIYAMHSCEAQFAVGISASTSYIPCGGSALLSAYPYQTTSGVNLLSASFTWFKNGSYIGTGNSIVATSVGSYSVSAYIVYQNSYYNSCLYVYSCGPFGQTCCAGGYQYYTSTVNPSNTYYVNGPSNLTPTVSLSSSSSSVLCANNTTSYLSASGISGANSVTYNFYRNGSLIQSSSNPNYGPFNAQNGDSYYVVALPTSALYCFVPSSATSNAISYTVNPANYYYADSDGDGFGAGSATFTCTQPGGYVSNNSDCNNSVAGINPNTVWHLDNDGDGYIGSVTLTQCAQPASNYMYTGYPASSDCDDYNAYTHPTQTEICNIVDDDCDGSTDEGVQTTYYLDLDADGFGDINHLTQSCSAVGGYVTNSLDCNDTNLELNPSTNWYLDHDQDAYYTTMVFGVCNQPTIYHHYNNMIGSGDCDDYDGNIHPGLAELCNGTDDNCDGYTDEGLLTQYFADTDGDSFGDPNNSTMACSMPVGYVTNSSDCNDGTAAYNPNTVWYLDADGDHYYVDGVYLSQCLTPGTGYAYTGLISGNDCDDSNNSVHPFGLETCNSIDDDCNAMVDDGVQTMFFNDVDNDGFGNVFDWMYACSLPVGYSSNSLDCDDNNSSLNPNTIWYLDNDADGYVGNVTAISCSQPSSSYSYSGFPAAEDCNDNNPSVYPTNTEICNSIDDNCNSNVDENVLTYYYQDADGDTYGNPSSGTYACTLPGGYVSNTDDCDDTNANLNPNTVWFLDLDADMYGVSTTSQCNSPGIGYSTSVVPLSDCDDSNANVNPSQVEACFNGMDDDCNGIQDENCGSGGAGDFYETPIVVSNLGQLGLNSFTMDVNMTQVSNSIQSPGTGSDFWIRFAAPSNAVQVALTGATGVGDDNELSLYAVPANPNVQLVPLQVENDVHSTSMGSASDAGNEVLIYSNLTPGQTYYACIRNTNYQLGTVKVKIHAILPSQSDVAIYTNNTGVYNNSCLNFKAKFQFNATSYTVNRWSSASATGTPLYSYTIPPTATNKTICQVGKILPANFSTGVINHYVTVDVNYALFDAYGNPVNVTSRGTVVTMLGVAPEAGLYVRTADQCPVFKNAVNGGIFSNRAVCGTSQYVYQFTETTPQGVTLGMPVVAYGAQGATRQLLLSNVPGILNGKFYSVKVTTLHGDGVTQGVWGPMSCVKTLGAAGMPTVEDDNNLISWSDDEHLAVVFPNPSNGSSAQLSIHNWDGPVTVKMFDVMGALVDQYQLVVDGASQVGLTQKSLSTGLYTVELDFGTRRESMRVVLKD